MIGKRDTPAPHRYKDKNKNKLEREKKQIVKHIVKIMLLRTENPPKTCTTWEKR